MTIPEMRSFQSSTPERQNYAQLYRNFALRFFEEHDRPYYEELWKAEPKGWPGLDPEDAKEIRRQIGVLALNGRLGDL